MKRRPLLPLSCLALCAAALPQASSAAEPVRSVPELDVSRYAGQWYGIAHLPTTFHEDCAGDIATRYSLEGGGRLGVLNTCTTVDGGTKSVQGVARLVEDHPGRLETRFAPDWLSWLPWAWADHWVIALDPEYEWAMVGEPDREVLWILAREPTMERARFEALRAHAEAMGYDLSALVVAAPLR